MSYDPRDELHPSTGSHGGQSTGTSRTYHNGFTVIPRNENALGIAAFHADGMRGKHTDRTEAEELDMAMRRAGLN